MMHPEGRNRSGRSVRWDARLSRLLLLAFVGLAAATAAQAQPTAWTYANKPSFAGTYQPPAELTYNSADGGKGETLITRLSAGVYNVAFKDLGNNLPGNVQVSAVGGSNYCNTSGWTLTPNRKSVVVGVRCFNVVSTPSDNAFTLLYIARAAPLGLSGPLQGFVSADRPSTASYNANPLYSYNSNYGQNSIVHTGTGTYMVAFTAMPTVGGVPLVTAKTTGPFHCQVENWTPNPYPTIAVSVLCSNLDSGNFDTEFSLLFTSGAAPGNGTGTGLGAYADGNAPGSSFAPPLLQYQFNDLNDKLLEERVLGTGQYQIVIPQPAKFATGIPLVGALSSSQYYCTIGTWFPSIATIHVNCYDVAGGHLENVSHIFVFQASSVP